MARKKDGERFGEIRLHDLVRKWITGCETAKVVLEKIVAE